MRDIIEIMNMLDWHMPLEIQAKGISLAKEVKDIDPFMQPLTPKHNKNIWENCAKVVASKSDKELEFYLFHMLLWLEDLNWPGALTILERLKKFSGGKLKNPLIDRVNDIMKQTDEENRAVMLGTLSELLENEELRERLPKEFADTLQKYRWNYK